MNLENLPAVLPKLSEAKVAPKGALNVDDLKKMLTNFVVFTAPALVVFFSLLSQGVPLEKAWPAGLLALYGVAADYFKKLNS